MSTESCSIEEPIDTIFQAEIEESSEEPPMDEWSSMDIQIRDGNKKLIQYDNTLSLQASGEACVQFVCMSASSILKHVYYNYPSISDPGIISALLDPEEKKQYPEHGQELYLALCKDMNQYPVRLFHRGLLKEEIDLRYYCVNPNGVRAMSLALKYNTFVKVLDLTDNLLNNDACYHLGEMFISNSSMSKLILSGCRIGHDGVRRILYGLQSNKSLIELNLNRNQLGDIGMEHIAQSVFLGLEIQKLHLSKNNIGTRGILAFTQALETHNKFVLLDLSWNNLHVPATYSLLCMLGESVTLQECNLSWNTISNPRIGLAIKSLTRASNLHTLNLSNNKLAGDAVVNLLGNLGNAKKLVTLDLSYNPLSPLDAVIVIKKLQLVTVKLRRLLLDNVSVSPKFLEILKQIKCMKSKRNVVVAYGGVNGAFLPKDPDMRELVLNRAEYLTKKQKNNQVDIALLVLQLLKDNILTMTTKDFINAMTGSGAPLDEDLLNEIVRTFAIPSSAKTKTIDIKCLADYVQRKWPERKLPPTPPPEPEPEPIPVEPRGKKIKGKKGRQ